MLALEVKKTQQKTSLDLFVTLRYDVVFTC